MTERSFLELENNGDQSGVKLDPREENIRLQKLYDTARADQQANYPDLYVSTGATAAKDTKDLTKALEEAKAETAKVQSEMTAKLEALMAKLTGKIDPKGEDAVQSAAKA